MRVRWLSRMAEDEGREHWFKGTVVRVYPADVSQGLMECAAVDDDSGLTYRVIPTYKLLELSK